MNAEFYLGFILVAVLLVCAFILLPQIIKLNRKLLAANVLAINNEHLISNMKIAGRKAREKNINLMDELKRKQRTINHKDQEIGRLKHDTVEKRATQLLSNNTMVDASRTINNLTFALESIYSQQGLNEVNKKNLKDFIPLFLKREWENARIIGGESLDISILHVEKILDWIAKDNWFDKICDIILDNVQSNISEFMTYGREGDLDYKSIFSNESHDESAKYFHEALLKDGFPEELIDTDLLLFVNRILIHPIGVMRGLCLDEIAGTYISKDRIVVVAYDNRINIHSLFIYPHLHIKKKADDALKNIYGSNGMVKPD